MLERFTRERQRAAKSAVFNLEDDEELTHYGQSLSKLDDFDDIGLRSDEEEDEANGASLTTGCLYSVNSFRPGPIGHDIVKQTHFGGFGDEDETEEVIHPRSGHDSFVITHASGLAHKEKVQSGDYGRSHCEKQRTQSLFTHHNCVDRVSHFLRRIVHTTNGP